MEPERVEYQSPGLSAADLAADPIAQFRIWLGEAAGAVPEANAMVLATVDASHRPRARAVLLKDVDETGFVFYTNYASAKGDELAGRPVAEACFVWLPLHRQVRVSGAVEPVTSAESDAYFASRPRGAQLAAWASEQSRRVASRAVLADAYAAAERRFAGRTVERPPDWGGFRLVPDRIEFWQGQPNRLHDRIVFTHDAGSWSHHRLAP